ncbi:hypothetical protein B484DRAFT_482772, partial [Ochromonadaceae sp. CCMP2298]
MEPGTERAEPPDSAETGVKCAMEPNSVPVAKSGSPLKGVGVGTAGKKKIAHGKKSQIIQKLQSLNGQLAEVRAARKMVKNDGRVSSGPKSLQLAKKHFSHPKLDYIYGEIMYSPYLTPPSESYPRTTYTITEQLKEYRGLGCEFENIPAELRPYDPKVLKKLLIKEVCHYSYIQGLNKGSMKMMKMAHSTNSPRSLPEPVPGHVVARRRRKLPQLKGRKSPSAMSLDSGLQALMEGMELEV